jgi:hypothetical protein
MQRTHFGMFVHFKVIIFQLNEEVSTRWPLNTEGTKRSLVPVDNVKIPLQILAHEV